MNKGVDTFNIGIYVILACVAALCLGIFLRFQEREAPLSEQDYAFVIAEAMEGDWASGVGTVYDLDGDGTRELILQHTKAEEIDADGTPHIAPMVGFSVYTMRKEGPVAIIEHENLYIEVGGNGGYLEIVKKDGELFLAVTCTGEGDAGCDSVLGKRDVYCIADEAAEKVEAASFSYHIGENGEMVNYRATVNGQSGDKGVFMHWWDAYDVVSHINPYTYRDPELGNPDVMSLVELAIYF